MFGTEFARIEEKMTKKRAKEIFDEHLLLEKTVGSFETLDFIFQDIYDFADREVTLSEEGFRFAPRFPTFQKSGQPLRDIEIKHVLKAALTSDVDKASL